MPPSWAHLLTLRFSHDTHLGGWGGAVREQRWGYVHTTLFQNSRPCKLGTWDSATPGRGHFTREGQRVQAAYPVARRDRALLHAHRLPVPSALLPYHLLLGLLLGVSDNASNLGSRALLWSVLVALLQSPVQRRLLSTPQTLQVTPPGVTTHIPIFVIRSNFFCYAEKKVQIPTTPPHPNQKNKRNQTDSKNVTARERVN